MKDSLTKIQPVGTWCAYYCLLFRRKSLSGNWKTNVGQSILEEVPVQEKYKGWIDQVRGGRGVINNLLIHFNN